MAVQVADRFAGIFELEAPVADFAALLNRQRRDKRRDLKLGERSLMLTPLALLAACGGGGGGGGPAPIPAPPPAPTPSPTPTPTPTPTPGTTTIDLAALGTGGATITASVTGAQFGFAIATLQPGATGDVVGDGRADLVVSAPFGLNGAGAGQVFIFDGANLSGGPVRTLNGSTAGDRFGFDVSVGDIGGNTRGDVLVGAPGFVDGSANSGRVFAFFGDGSVNNATSSPTGANGFTLTINGSGDGTVAFPNATGDLGPNLGAAVSIIGDVNGDGRNDFFVADPGLNNNGVQDVGESYVGFGQATYPGATVGVGSLSTPGMGFRVLGAQQADGEGYTAAASGQINGAGGTDLVVADARGGTVAVRFGNAAPGGSTVDNNTDLTGANGTRLTSSDASARFGESIAVGDINGDGLADIIVGAPGVSKVYILLGAASYASGTIDVASPGSASVIEISGTGGFGSSVAFIGAFNATSGPGDFVVGAPSDGANGSAYVILGSTSASATAFSLTGANALKLSGGAPGTGAEVAGPGDLNGDGLADVAVAAVNATTNANGTVYVVFGRSVQGAASVGQEALAFDDGSGDLFGGGASASTATIDPMLAANDMPPNELFI